MSAWIRDKSLLDAIDGAKRESFSGAVWRSVQRNRKPDECSRSGGRWDDQNFDVLYTSLEKDGAIEERRFHLYRGQPFPPSRIQYDLHQINLRLNAVIAFREIQALQSLGMATENYGRAAYVERAGEYPRSQEIAEACFFLGADGILVPNARHDSLNLVVFCDQDPPPTIGEHWNMGTIDW